LISSFGEEFKLRRWQGFIVYKTRLEIKKQPLPDVGQSWTSTTQI